MSCPFAHLDGSYVLGALSPRERLDFERHLGECSECRLCVSELAGLPGLLSHVDLSDLEPHPQASPPPTLLPSLVREVRRVRRRRSVVTAAGATAAAVAVVAGSLAVGHALDNDRAPRAAPTSTSGSATPTVRAMTPVGPGPVAADVALTRVPWGTRLDLACTYAPAERPAHPGEGEYAEDVAVAYALVVRTREGAVEQVATWRPLPGRTMRLAAATASGMDDIVAVEVRTADGVPVLRLAV